MLNKNITFWRSYLDSANGLCFFCAPVFTTIYNYNYLIINCHKITKHKMDGVMQN